MKKIINNLYIRFYLAYTILFFVMVSVIFHQYYANGISFVWKVDGWNQHYKALYLYSDWLREIARSLFVDHKPLINLYSFALGYGSDVISTLHYYVIGDPVCLFSALVPKEYLAHFYTFSIYTRLYLAGAAYAGYCFSMKKTNLPAVLAGILLYCFPFLLPINLIKHPFFLNPYIYLPLLLTGVEKILEKSSRLPFILAVFLSAISNFYFFYMLVLLVVIYVTVRLAAVWKDQGFTAVLRYLRTYLGCGITGVLMSCLVLVPVIYLYLQGSRANDTLMSGINFLYSPEFYKRLFANVFTKNIDLELSCIGFFCLLLLFIRRKNGQLIAGFLVLLAILLSPLGGKMMNGFSYVSDRWIFGLLFLLAYITTAMWEDLFACRLKEMILILVIFSLYYGWMIWVARSLNDTIGLAMFRHISFISMATILLLLLPKFIHFKWLTHVSSVACLLLLALTAITRLHFATDPDWINISDQYASYEMIDKDMLPETDRAVLSVVDNKDGFFRYGAPYNETKRNSQIISGLKGMSYYWSLSDRIVSDYMVEMGLPFAMVYKLRNLDDVTSLTDLASVKYYVIRSKKGRKKLVPFGFRKIKQIKEEDSKGTRTYSVYENDYFLPFGYTYDSVIRDKEYNDMNYMERQNAVLQGVHISDQDRPNGFPDTKVVQDCKPLKYHIVSSEGVEIDRNHYLVKGDKAKVTFEIEDAASNCSTGLLFNNATFIPDQKDLDLYVREHANIRVRFNEEGENNAETSLFLGTENFYLYTGRKDFLLNLGYSEKPKKRFTIIFPYKGTYILDKITPYNQPMARYPKMLNKLRKNCLRDISFHNNTFTGNIKLDSNKILCLPMTYSIGWKAWVNGKKTRIIKGNSMFMILSLKKGFNKVRLQYCTPYLPLGLILSLLGFLIVIILFICEKRGAGKFSKKKNSKKRTHRSREPERFSTRKNPKKGSKQTPIHGGNQYEQQRPKGFFTGECPRQYCKAGHPHDHGPAD